MMSVPKAIEGCSITAGVIAGRTADAFNAIVRARLSLAFLSPIRVPTQCRGPQNAAPFPRRRFTKVCAAAPLKFFMNTKFILS